MTPEWKVPLWLSRLLPDQSDVDRSCPENRLTVKATSGKAFYASKLVLAAASQIMKEAMADGTTDDDDICLLFPEHDGVAVRGFLDYVHSGLARCSSAGAANELRQLLDELGVWHGDEEEKSKPVLPARKNFTENTSKTNSEKEDPKSAESYQCQVCSRTFKRENNYSIHLLHHRKEVLKCSFCSKEFRRPGQRKAHEMLHTKPFKCSQCDAAFGRRSNYVGHLRLHAGDRPYICDVCGKGFPISSSLITHKKQSHSKGKKPHACDSCSLDFISKSQLLVHKRTHTHERPHVCETCGKSFSTKPNLTCHMRKHSSGDFFSCQICSEKFRWKQSLNRHMMNHTGVRPFHCQDCNQAFKSSDAYGRHRISVHSKFKHFSCAKCELNFSTRSGAARHTMKCKKNKSIT